MEGSEPPNYTKYRARPKLLGREPKDWGDQGAPSGDRPPRQPGGGWRDKLPTLRRGRRPRTGGRKPITFGRVVKWLALGVFGWLLLSLVLFLVSAQIQQGKVSDETNAALAGGSLPLTSPTNILVL